MASNSNIVAGIISTLAKAKAYVEIFAVMKALSSVDIPRWKFPS